MEDESFYKLLRHNETLCIFSSKCDCCEVKSIYIDNLSSEIGLHVTKYIFRLFQETNHIFFNTTVRTSNLPIYTALKHYV